MLRGVPGLIRRPTDHRARLPDAPAALRPTLRGTIHRWSVPVAIALTVVLAVRVDTGGQLAAVLVYGTCVTAMLAVSGVYHPRRLSHRERRFLRRLDHTMILVGIAGTYTAVIVLALDGTTRVVLLVVAWGLAVVGTAIRMVWLDAPSGLVALVYVVAGWQVVLDLPAYVDRADAAEMTMLAVGGGRTASAPSCTRRRDRTRGRPSTATTRCSTPFVVSPRRATGWPCCC